MTDVAQKLCEDLIEARRARNAALIAMRNSRGGLIRPEHFAFEKAEENWDKTVSKLDAWIASQETP